MCNLTYELYMHAKHEGEMEGEIKGRKEGEIKGKTELRLEIYRKMKDNHMDDDIIMNVLNIDSEQLFALQQTSITETMSVPVSGPSLQEQ